MGFTGETFGPVVKQSDQNLEQEVCGKIIFVGGESSDQGPLNTLIQGSKRQKTSQST